MRLQNKLLIPLSLLTIIPLMLLGVFAAYYASNSLQKRVAGEMNSISETMSALVLSRLGNARSNLELFASNRLLKKYLLSGDERYSLQQPSLMRQLSAYQNAFPEYFEISVILNDGFEDTRVTNRKMPNATMDESDSAIIRALQKQPDDSVVQLLAYHSDADELAISMGKVLRYRDPLVPYKAEGVVVRGYLTMMMDISFIQTLITRVKVGKSGFLMVADSQGEIIFKPSNVTGEFEALNLQAIHTHYHQSPFSIVAHSAQSTKKREYMALVQKINDDFTLVAAIPQSEINQVLWQIAMIVFAVILSVILIILMLAYRHVSKLLLDPIYRLKDMVTSIGEGNVRVPIPADIKSDEFGELYDSIQKMRLNLNKSQEQVKQLAYYDDLTGLPNRITLRQELDAMINNSQRSELHFAVVFVDLDNFKDINDTLGHDMGDILLKEVSSRILKNIRNDDYVVRQRDHDIAKDCATVEPREHVVARLGGDEFTLLLGNIENVAVISKVVKRILDSFLQPIKLGEHDSVVGASMGIAIYPQDGRTADELLKNADLAMYEAKKSGKNNFEFFSKEMNAVALQRLALESNLRRALDRSEFVLYYQPRILASDEHVDGFEALIRWNNRELGIVPPNQFIPFAEESLLICEIGYWVLDNACQQIRQWVDEGYSDICVSVNLSPKQIYRGDTFHMIETAMKYHGVQGRNLEIEITESGLLKDEKVAIEFLENVKGLGVRLALDDFGTGYSSLSYLRKLPIDILRIDRSFVVDVVGDGDTANILESIIELAGKLSLKTVAEGVETVQQLELLNDLGCDYIQGYYYSKPLPLDKANEYLNLHKSVVNEVITQS